MHNKRYVRLLLPAFHPSPSKNFPWIWFLCLGAQQSKARGILKQKKINGKKPHYHKKGPQGLGELKNGITEGYAILDI